MKHDIPDESIDLIYLDPPFFTGKVQKSSESGYLFKWSNPSINNTYLVEFLADTLKVECTKNTKFYKTNNDSTLNISNGKSTVKINLDKGNRKAYLVVDDGRFCELKVAGISKGTFVINRKVKWDPSAMQISYDDSKSFWSNKEILEQSPRWLLTLATEKPKSYYHPFARYLYYMMERLQECYRVLKPTGSIYLHCDWRASHYLRMVMDLIFGYDCFQREIIWDLGNPSGYKSLAENWIRGHDTILFYKRSRDIKCTFNKQYEEYSKEYKDFLKKQKVDLKTKKGIAVTDVWKGIHSMQCQGTSAKEGTGWPTQKPLGLLERIILSSSNKGDIVLDPFCGCGTTIIKAHELSREYIGIDIHPQSFNEIKDRCRQSKLSMVFKPPSFIHATKGILEWVMSLNWKEFEEWVNDYYHAEKPMPDDGVDGITPEGIPIQTKSGVKESINSDMIELYCGKVKRHWNPKIKRPIKEILFVSQNGFNDNAIEQAYKIKNDEGIKVKLLTPKDILGIE